MQQHIYKCHQKRVKNAHDHSMFHLWRQCWHVAIVAYNSGSIWPSMATTSSMKACKYNHLMPMAYVKAICVLQGPAFQWLLTKLKLINFLMFSNFSIAWMTKRLLMLKLSSVYCVSVLQCLTTFQQRNCPKIFTVKYIINQPVRRYLMCAQKLTGVVSLVYT